MPPPGSAKRNDAVRADQVWHEPEDPGHLHARGRDAAAVRHRPARAGAQHQSDRPYAPAALCPGQGRHRAAASRRPCLPDTNAHQAGRGAAASLYRRIRRRASCGARTPPPATRVCADLWESYLEPSMSHAHAIRRSRRIITTSTAELPSDPALRVKALESLLTEKGLVDPATIDAWIEIYESKIGPRNGAKVVAKAWVDPAYKQRLLERRQQGDRRAGFPRPPGPAHRRGREHAATSITWSSAPCAPAIRCRCWACRRPGTSRRRTARAR